MAEKPTAAFVLSLIAAIFILLNGLLLAAVGGAAAFFFGAELFLVLASVAIVSGVIVLLGAIMLNSKPEQHVTWGVLVLVFSIISIFTGGGFIIGFILGIVGGALGIAWKPTAAVPGAMGGMPGMPANTRTCLGCGRQISVEYKVCPHCGTPAPVAPTARPGPPPSPPTQP